MHLSGLVVDKSYIRYSDPESFSGRGKVPINFLIFLRVLMKK